MNVDTKAGNKGKNSKITPELKKLIEDRFCKTWSSEQIVGRELTGKLSFKTIYNLLYNNFLDVSLNCAKKEGKKSEN